jgi:hypothetical protein
VAPGVLALVDRIKALGYRLDLDLLDRYELHRASHRSALREIYLDAMARARKSPGQPSRMEQLTAMIDDPAVEAAWRSWSRTSAVACSGTPIAWNPSG